MYHTGQDIIRGIKLIFAWMLAALATWFVLAMPDNPELALGGLIVLVVILVPSVTLTTLAIAFSIARRAAESDRTKID